MLDIILLALIVPLGIVMCVLVHKGRLWAKMFVAGIFASLAFTYGFYALSIYLNEVFLVYGIHGIHEKNPCKHGVFRPFRVFRVFRGKIC